MIGVISTLSIAQTAPNLLRIIVKEEGQPWHLEGYFSETSYATTAAIAPRKAGNR
jgi:hypothetical protein